VLAQSGEIDFHRGLFAAELQGTMALPGCGRQWAESR
jgi:hypothetical protein